MSLRPDKSISRVTPITVHTWSRYGAIGALRAAGLSAGAGSVTWVANSAVYIPLFLPFPYVINRLCWVNGGTITSSNVDCGLYDFNGNLIVKSGSVAMASSNALQFASLSTPIVIPMGSYYMGWWCNNTTSRAYGLAISATFGRMGGLLQQASLTSGLPSTMTPAAYSPLGYVPCGISRTITGW